MGLQIRKYPISPRRRKIIPDENDLGFGQVFTDHMFIMRWTEKCGWHDALIQPYQFLKIDPAANVLHYGQAIFEGMKAYSRSGNRFALFRPEENICRLNKSAERLCMPVINEKLLFKALVELVKTDARWIPKDRGCSLYIRPNMFAVESGLGVKPAKEYIFTIILSPVSCYFKEGFAPTAISVEETMSRVADGGMGSAKVAGNYAASLLADKQASQNGYAQVLWLDSREHRFVEEVGAMNVFFVQSSVDSNVLLTSRLNGNILPGVTRDSIIELARENNISVVEAYFDMNDISQDIRSGVITEAFGSGTAAVIAPIGEFLYKERSIKFGHGKIGSVTRMLYDMLIDIQYGDYGEKSHEWIKIVNI